MIRYSEYHQVTFKVNTSGSWANLVTCPGDRAEAIKSSCEVIAQAGQVKFKIVDATGYEIERYGRTGSGYGWYTPSSAR